MFLYFCNKKLPITKVTAVKVLDKSAKAVYNDNTTAYCLQAIYKLLVITLFLVFGQGRQTFSGR